MRKIFIAVTIVVVLLVFLLVVPFLIPLNTYKKEAETRISQMMGRDIKIEGDIRFKLLPQISIALKNVSVGNPKGFTSPHLAKVGSFEIDVELKPLLNKQVVVQKLVIVKPEINLEKNNSGEANWNITFSKPKLPTAANLGLISDAHAQEDSNKSFTVKDINLSGFAIKDGKVHFSDAASKSSVEITDIALKTETIATEKPVNVEGSFVWNKTDFNVLAKAASIRDILEQKPTNVSIKLNSDQMKLNFNGNASPAGAVGNLELSISSIVKLMSWLGKPINWDKTLLQFIVSGNINCSTTQCSLNKSKIALDHLLFAGDLKADYSNKLAISGSLNTGVLNLKPFMSHAAKVSMMPSVLSNAYANASRWSTNPINLSGLSAFDLDLSLTADDFIAPPWQLKNNHLRVIIDNSKATLQILKASFLDGSIKGVISASPNGSITNVGCDMQVAGVNIESLLKVLSDDDRLKGKGNIDIKLGAAGANIADMVNSLDGSGSVQLRDGAIKGINLAQMARNVKSAFSTQERGVQQTDFSELGGSFTINDGLIKNDDLAMKSPYIRLGGKGNINLPAYTINYRLVPKLVDTGKGQGGVNNKIGIEVPILVTGPLDNPRFAPDLQSIITDAINNPENIKENIGTIKNVIKENKGEIKQDLKNLKDSVKDPKGLLKDPNKLNDLLGGFSKKPSAESPQAKPEATSQTPVVPSSDPVKTPPSLQKNTPFAPAPASLDPTL